MNPHSYAHIIFGKVTKIYDGEKTTNVSVNSGYLPTEN
jgi:hypothetical protein